MLFIEYFFIIFSILIILYFGFYCGLWDVDVDVEVGFDVLEGWYK